MPRHVKKVSAGDPFDFPASFYNRLVDVTGADIDAIGPLGVQLGAGVIVNIKNSTGSDRSRFDCVTLGDASFTTTDGKADICFATATADPWKKLAVLQEPIANGKRGRALIHGLTWVKCTGDASHRYGFLDTANHRIKAATGGQVRLLGAPDSTEVIIPCLVGEHQRMWRLTWNADVGAAATQTADLLNMDGVDTGLDVTMTNTITLHDEDATDDPALCFEANGLFFAYQGPC